MCTIYGVRVNLVTLPGGSQELRVTGQASNCPGDQVVVTSSITNPSPPPVQVTSGRFRVELPVTATQPVQCGQIIAVRVECLQDPTCAWQDMSLEVPCCTLQIVSAQGQVPLGQLAPNSIVVSGALVGCYSDKVVVRVRIGSNTIGPSPATPVDPYTGSFYVGLPVPANLTVRCDDRTIAEAECDGDPTCRDRWEGRLQCGACPNVQVSHTAGACHGQPPVKPVTLEADINNIPAGQSATFEWDYGDGQLGPQFTINNATGNAGTVYHHTEPSHDYAPGTYTARLRVLPPYECTPFDHTVTVQCQEQCPVITADVIEGQCNPDGTRQPTELIVEFTPPLSAGTTYTIQWTSSIGPPTQVSDTVPANTTIPDLRLQVAYAAGGTYWPSANVSLTLPGATTPCPASFLAFTHGPQGTPNGTVIIGTCPTPPPTCYKLQPLTVPNPMPCAQGNTPISVTIGATTTPAPPTVAAAYSGDFEWKVEDRDTNQVLFNQVVPSQAGGTSSLPAGLTFPGAGRYRVYVEIENPGCPPPDDDDDKSVDITIPDCDCPIFTVKDLTANPNPNDPCVWTFSVSVALPVTPVQVTYNWDFGDGTTQQTSTPSATHTYSSSGQRTVSVAMTAPNCDPQQLARQISVVCSSRPPSPPAVTGCSVTAGASGAGSLRVTFDSDVEPGSATDPANYSININNGPSQNPAAGSVSYDPVTRTTTITGLSIDPGDIVAVTVTGVRDATGTVTIGTQNTARCVAPSDGNGGGCFEILCWILLILALLLLLLAALAIIAVACFPLDPATKLALIIFAIAAAVLGLFLLGLWVVLCGRGKCDILRWLFRIFSALAAIMLLIAAILAAIQNYPCSVGFLIDAGLWSTAATVVANVAEAVGCSVWRDD